MRKFLSGLLLLAALFGFSAFSANTEASIISNGDYTSDTDSGLDWLDMSFTDGKTYNETLGLISGGSLNGWRFATSAEFDTLMENAIGGPVPAYYFSTTTFAAMSDLTAKMGYTFDSPYDSAVGYVDSSALGFADARQFGFRDLEGYIRPAGDTNWDRTKDYVGEFQGSFLVRSSVPEPASCVIFGSLCFLASCIRRRKVT